MGKIIQIKKRLPYDPTPRTLQIYLPRHYEKRVHERFPVLYMHDGQNLFFNETSYAGISWGVKQTMEAVERKGYPGMIVVGIENAGDARVGEYSAFPIRDGRGYEADARGMQYLDWLVYELKPHIDRLFRTLPHREHTFMAGSSAGANISFYAGVAHGATFAKIGLFSTALWLFEEADTRDFLSAWAGDESSFFIACGTEEGGRNRSLSHAYIDTSLWLYHSLRSRGVQPEKLALHIEQGLNHSERAWRTLFHRFLRFLIG